VVGGGSCERGAAVVRRRARPVRWITAGVMISHLQGSYLSEAQADHLEAAQSTEVLRHISKAINKTFVQHHCHHRSTHIIEAQLSSRRC